jgi:hypothetical protein
MIRYLYLCPRCSHTNLLSATQAGQELTCAGCNQSFEVPQLQVLRQFAVEKDSTAVKEKSTSWAARDMLFVIGMICLIVGSSSGYGLYRYSNSLIDDIKNPDKEIEMRVDSLSSGAVLWDWYHIEKNPDLPDWLEHPIIGRRKQGNILKKVAYGLCGIGGCGFLLVATSLLMRRGKS